MKKVWQSIFITLTVLVAASTFAHHTTCPDGQVFEYRTSVTTGQGLEEFFGDTPESVCTQRKDFQDSLEPSEDFTFDSEVLTDSQGAYDCKVTRTKVSTGGVLNLGLTNITESCIDPPASCDSANNPPSAHGTFSQTPSSSFCYGPTQCRFERVGVAVGVRDSSGNIIGFQYDYLPTSEYCEGDPDQTLAEDPSTQTSPPNNIPDANNNFCDSSQGDTICHSATNPEDTTIDDDPFNLPDTPPDGCTVSGSTYLCGSQAPPDLPPDSNDDGVPNQPTSTITTQTTNNDTQITNIYNVHTINGTPGGSGDNNGDSNFDSAAIEGKLQEIKEELEADEPTGNEYDSELSAVQQYSDDAIESLNEIADGEPTGTSLDVNIPIQSGDCTGTAYNYHGLNVNTADWCNSAVSKIKPVFIWILGIFGAIAIWRLWTWSTT